MSKTDGEKKRGNTERRISGKTVRIDAVCDDKRDRWVGRDLESCAPLQMLQRSSSMFDKTGAQKKCRLTKFLLDDLS